MRVVVIGGGVIGLACAYQLSSEGAQVTLLDCAREAREASWAAAGMLAPHHEAARPDGLWRLGAESLARWPAFAQALGGDELCDHRQHGGLVPIANAGDVAAGEARAAALARVGIHAEWWNQARLQREEPALGPQLLGAWWIPGGQVDPRRLLAALQQACAALVALRYGAEVIALDGQQVVLRDGARLDADHIVVASGAWTPALARSTGIVLEGEPVKGQMLRLQAPDGLLRHFVHSHHAYVVPRRGCGLVIGSTMVEAGFDRSCDPLAIEALAEQARALVPQLAHVAVAEQWTGLRPRLRGGQPVIAQVRPGVIVATGHFRNGILLTPATAAAVSALVHGRAVSADARPFTSFPPATAG